MALNLSRLVQAAALNPPLRNKIYKAQQQQKTSLSNQIHQEDKLPRVDKQIDLDQSYQFKSYA